MKNGSLSICIYSPHKSINGYSFKDVGPIILSVKNLAQHTSVMPQMVLHCWKSKHCLY